MDPLDRLAAYLAGELDADERAAVDAELARDPGLEARLAAMRRADRALSRVRSPEPPAGFDDRLRAAVDAELDRLLGSAPAAPAAVAGDTAEPTTARRVETPQRAWGARLGERFRWAPALAGAAAGLLVLGGVGIVVADRFAPGEADDEVAAEMTLDAADEPMGSLAAPDAERMATGPIVVDAGRILSDDEAADLLELPELVAVAAESLDPPTAAVRAEEFRDVLAAPAPPDEGPSIESAAGDDVARCLEGILAAEAPPIPVYVELATSTDGSAVLAYGLVTLDPETGAYTRREVWLVDRDTCHVRQFVQH